MLPAIYADDAFINQLNGRERMQWDEWDVLFIRKECKYVLWPLSRMKVFCKVERANTRRAPQESVGPGAVFTDRDISIVHCKKKN